MGDHSETVLVTGDNVRGALNSLNLASYRAMLIELGSECLGIHTGESFGSEGNTFVGFSRFRLGDLPPTKPIELVAQPHTQVSALEAARSNFRDGGYATVRCRDDPGRIVHRLARPYFNRALEALNSRLGEAPYMPARRAQVAAARCSAYRPLRP